MKNVILITLFNFLITYSYSQERHPVNNDSVVSNPPYIIDKYLIDPEHKTVGVYTIGGKGEVGETAFYQTDSTINFNNTTLLILGRLIIFKEYFPFKVNFDSIKVLSSDNRSVFFEYKSSIYFFSTMNFPSTITNFSKYRKIIDWIYQDTAGNIYQYNYFRPDKLEQITGLRHLDLKTLKHIVGHYYQDKNGLYFFGRHLDNKLHTDILESAKVENSKGEDIKPVITKNYFVYNNHIYSFKREEIERLNLDVNKIQEVEGYFITDGKNLYEDQRRGYSDNDLDNSFNVNSFFKTGVQIEWIISPRVNLTINESRKELYFAIWNHDRKIITEKAEGILVKTADGYCLLNEGIATRKFKKIDKVLIYNIDKKEDEEFDASKFLFFQDNIFVYKNHLFMSNIPVREELNTMNLRYISKYGINTNFIIDGKSLIYIGNITGYSIDNSSSQEKVILKDHILRDVDFTKLKIINKDILVTDKYIYNHNSCIPIANLGLKVRFFPDEF